MNTAETEAAPPEGAQPEPKPVVDTTPKPSTDAGSQDNSTSRDPQKARSILRGEIPEEKSEPEGSKAESETDTEVIARMFDPETGEFIEHEEADDEPPAGKAEKKSEAKPEAKTEEAAPGDDETGEEEETGEPEPKKRIAIKRGRLSDQDFAVVQLADREKISLDDARARLFPDGMPAAKKTEQETAPTETPESVQVKIDALLEQRKAANKALDVEKGTELTDQIADLKAHQRELRQRAASQEQDATARHADATIASATKAVELYPDSAKEGTELFEAIDSARIERLRTDPSFFQNKNWPMVLAVEIAAEMGVAPVTKKAAAEVKLTKPAAVAPPKKPARPAPPNPASGTATGAAQTNQEDTLRAELKTAKDRKDASAIKAVMRKIDLLPAGR